MVLFWEQSSTSFNLLKIFSIILRQFLVTLFTYYIILVESEELFIVGEGSILVRVPKYMFASREIILNVFIS